MASKTAQTEYRRKLRRQNAGKKDRRVRTNKGTTPAFPIHQSEAAPATGTESAQS